MSKTFNIYCDESCHLENDESNVMTLGAVWHDTNITKDTARRLRKIKPNTEVVIITGFMTLAKELIDADIEKGICKILYKPINLNSLYEVVDEIITAKDKGKENA